MRMLRGEQSDECSGHLFVLRGVNDSQGTDSRTLALALPQKHLLVHRLVVDRMVFSRFRHSLRGMCPIRAGKDVWIDSGTHELQGRHLSLNG